jgi:hypothetical protein
MDLRDKGHRRRDCAGYLLHRRLTTAATSYEGSMPWR